MHDAFGICCRQSIHSEEAVSADDLLSTTIAAIVVAQPQHLISCLEYLKLFHGTGDWSGKTGFQVATLEAAAAYLEQINPSCSPLSAAGSQIIKSLVSLHTATKLCQSRGHHIEVVLKAARAGHSVLRLLPL